MIKEPVMTNKERFIALLAETHRKGVENVIEKLEELGFFEAPASTVFHLNYSGGLLQHSLNVYDEAMAIVRQQIEFRPEMAEKLPLTSVTVAALLHDVCKAEIYREALKWRKDNEGKWESYNSYEVDYSSLPLGHGEKSVIRLLQWGMELTDEEMLAIRWHMGPWELAFQSNDAKGNSNAAKNKTPLCSVIGAADGLATFVLES